jgi:hypothetical protein
MTQDKKKPAMLCEHAGFNITYYFVMVRLPESNSALKPA